MVTDSQSDLPYWVAWAWSHKIGPRRLALLRRHFPDLKTAWRASSTELRQAGLETELIDNIINYRAQTDPNELMANLDKLGIKTVIITDDNYPKLLKEIYDPPPVLFYKGDSAAWQKNCLAIVGTRRATSYGLRVANELTKDLALAGLTIVSGLAYGIDAATHQATIAVNGQTIAVLAAGLDIIYPSANRTMAYKIIEQGGALITEFPPGTPPLKQNFPYRNRIIAGLARAVLVIEATADSGALITAKQALESNREVFAVPGSIFIEQAQGTNELLKLGSHVTTTASDVLDCFGLAALPQKPLSALSTEQEEFLQLFTSEAQAIDDLIRATGLSAADFMAKLTILELAGWVKETSPRHYSRVG